MAALYHMVGPCDNYRRLPPDNLAHQVAEQDTNVVLKLSGVGFA